MDETKSIVFLDFIFLFVINLNYFLKKRVLLTKLNQEIIMSSSLLDRCRDQNNLEKCIHLSFTDLRSEIEKMAEHYHHSFCIRCQSTFYILWADGEITEETIVESTNPFYSFLCTLMNYRISKTLYPPSFTNAVFLFPLSRYPFTGCILSLEECIEFREWIFRVFHLQRSKRLSINQ